MDDIAVTELLDGHLLVTTLMKEKNFQKSITTWKEGEGSSYQRNGFLFRQCHEKKTSIKREERTRR